MLLAHDAIYNNAANTPSKIAVSINGETISYKNLIKLTDEIVSLLSFAGTKPGDRVGIYAETSFAAVAAFIAILKIGAVTAVIHRTHSRPRLSQLLKSADAKILITDLTEADNHEILRPPLISIIRISESLLKKKNAVYSSPNKIADKTNWSVSGCVTPESPASIFFTSGSSFQPKGVLVNHMILTSVISRITTYLENTANDRILTYSGLGSDYGVYNILMPLCFGGTSVVITSQPIHHNEIVHTLAREEITGMHIFPPVFCLLATSLDTDQYSVPKLRYISSSGQMIHINSLKLVREKFPAVLVYSSYGLTEYKRVSYLDPKLIDIKPTSVGKPLPGVRIYLVDSLGQLISLPGKTGELWLAGDHLMLEYWNNPTANRMAFEYNRFGEAKLYKSGDLFKKDEDGFLYYVARKDDIFARNGWKVNPRDVEKCISSHSGVFAVLVIPQASDLAGQVPKAFVVLMERSTHTSPEELIEHCRSHLDWHMVPVECEIVKALPCTHSGKFSPADLI